MSYSTGINYRFNETMKHLTCKYEMKSPANSFSMWASSLLGLINSHTNSSIDFTAVKLQIQVHSKSHNSHNKCFICFPKCYNFPNLPDLENSLNNYENLERIRI